MLLQIKVCAAVNTFQFFPAEWEFVFDIYGRIGIMRQFHMVMKAELGCGNTDTLVPEFAGFFPVCIPFKLAAGPHKELHFHLLKLPHTKDELACYDFITKCFTGLCNTKRNFHPACFLHIEKVYKNSLGCFWAQVHYIVFRIVAGHGTKFRFKHQVKQPHIRPVTGFAHAAGNFMVFYQRF